MKVNSYDQQILRIALPAIITNITIPLLGLVDTAIVGHMGDAAYIGAVAVGSMMFNLVYWIFGFLRMGTSGLTAQARGRRSIEEMGDMLRKSAKTALTISALLLLLQLPLRELLLWFISPTADVRPLAVTYYNIVVWGAPAVLGLYALTGWFIGMQNTRFPMFISILQNLLNIVASLTLVYGFGMKVEGIALGTVIAQYAGYLLGLGLLWKYYQKPIKKHRNLLSYKRFFQVNRNIFLRTLCLVAVNLYFTALGARQGATILAVNALLIQLYLLFSYILDGFAYAGEALVGRYWGAKNDTSFRAVVKRLFGWGALMTIVFTIVYVAGGMSFLHLLTNETGVIAASGSYLWWACLIPVCGVAAFIWDGIFIGMTETRGMLLSSAIATFLFFVIALLLIPLWGNHGLWFAMLLYLATRGVVQTVIYLERY